MGSYIYELFGTKVSVSAPISMPIINAVMISRTVGRASPAGTAPDLQAGG